MLKYAHILLILLLGCAEQPDLSLDNPYDSENLNPNWTDSTKGWICPTYALSELDSLKIDGFRDGDICTNNGAWWLVNGHDGIRNDSSLILPETGFVQSGTLPSNDGSFELYYRLNPDHEVSSASIGMIFPENSIVSDWSAVKAIRFAYRANCKAQVLVMSRNEDDWMQYYRTYIDSTVSGAWVNYRLVPDSNFAPLNPENALPWVEQAKDIQSLGFGGSFTGESENDTPANKDCYLHIDEIWVEK